jgi:hypothetical protein
LQVGSLKMNVSVTQKKFQREKDDKEAFQFSSVHFNYKKKVHKESGEA